MQERVFISGTLAASGDCLRPNENQQVKCLDFDPSECLDWGGR